MNIKKLLHINLRMFGEGGGAESGSAPSGATPEVTRPVKKAGEYDNVVFGKQEPTESIEEVTAPQEQAEEPVKEVSKADKKKAFQDLIKGEYKEEFSEAHQEIFDRRFKNHKELEAKDQKTQPIIDALMSKYGIEDGNLDALNQAIQNDDDMWEQAADEAGMPVDQFKKFKELEKAQKELEEIKSQEAARDMVADWFNQGEALKERFPNFDLQEELQDDQFVNMLKSGVPVEHAFKVMHFDEIQQGAAQKVASITQKKVADSVRAKGMRPDENGTTQSNGIISKPDVHQLSKADRAEIARRVNRGEKIVF